MGRSTNLLIMKQMQMQKRFCRAISVILVLIIVGSIIPPTFAWDENELAEEYYYKALDASKNENYYDADYYIDQAIWYNSSYADAYRTRAALKFFNLNMKPEAYMDIDTAIQLDSTNSWYLTTKVIFLLSDERYPESLEVCKKMLALDPNDPWAHLYMGHAYKGVSENENAIKHYDKVLELASNNPSDTRILISYANDAKSDIPPPGPNPIQIVFVGGIVVFLLLVVIVWMRRRKKQSEPSSDGLIASGTGTISPSYTDSSSANDETFQEHYLSVADQWRKDGYLIPPLDELKNKSRDELADIIDTLESRITLLKRIERGLTETKKSYHSHLNDENIRKSIGFIEGNLKKPDQAGAVETEYLHLKKYIIEKVNE